MTETEVDPYVAAHLPMATNFMARVEAAAIAPDKKEAVSHLVQILQDDELVDMLIGLAMRVKVDSIVLGRVAYEIRVRTPDGEWGREVRKLAAACQVSDRTIHRWVSAAQEHFGLELTTAQANARTQADARQQTEDFGDTSSWDDWDEGDELAAAGFTDPDLAGLDGQMSTRDLVGEPWLERDSTSPSPRYENPPEGGFQPAGRPVIPADETWLAFAEAQIVDEHPALGPNGAAAKSAKARWDKMVREEPLELLGQLEMIHEGGDVPDELAAALVAAEESRPLKPEVVDKPKRQRASGGSTKTPEGLMVAVRELHQKIVVTRNEQGARAVATEFGQYLNELQSLAQVAQGCLTKVRAAVDESKRAEPAAAAGDGKGEPW